ncbi:MAG: 6,7-dimethyl-8-ribityllumazine synthase [Chitinophagales bacterium]|nr:MAG: 6,7-dimethyl-8-ribityllumazine synthase [Chitinophagales bacterium]
MATRLKNLSDLDAAPLPEARGWRVGVVVADYHRQITRRLLDGCIRTLMQCGIKEKDIRVVWVPGAFELPAGAQMLAGASKVEAIVCLGCVIKGETKHDEYINQAVATGITQLSLALKKPVIFGLLTTQNLRQAKDRAGGRHGNKGVEAALTAVKMIALHRKLKR